VRLKLVGIQSGPVCKPAVSITNLSLPVGPTGTVDIGIIRPEGTEAIALPIVVYCHGGGWVRGGRATHDRLVRELAVGAGVAVVFVDYALAPGAQFPTQNEQAYAVMCAMVDNAAALGLDGARLAVAGDGVGGAMAAALTLQAKARRGPAIGFQLLLYPMTAYLSDQASYRTFENGPWLSAADMRYFFDAEFTLGSSPDASAFPLTARISELVDLPAALVITAENDILRDEGEAYARKLMQAGVRVTATRYIGTIHDFMSLNGLSETPPTQAAVAQACTALVSAFAALARN
jgi:acetyl esterase